MKPITILPFYPDGESNTGWLLNNRYAITGDGEVVSLVEITSTDNPDTYKQASYYLVVARTNVKSLTAILKIVEQLKAMSAYTLITEHFDHGEANFDINK
jgi:hypothetical protein